ncbi:MAG: dTDP-4-dehydrorhamnose reductase [Acidobacteria bacterium]|nr:dTDP-4-dehydrorhamnose reductase [Acidobacteriota bacterium]
MKILIVGSRGMLGTDLMDIMGSSHAVSGFDLPDLDITQLEQCLAKVSQIRPDVVINAAAFTRVDECETNETDAFRINGYGAGNLAQAASAAGSLLVHYSTDYVFDGRKKEPYLEDDEPNPQSAYGRSKLLGETLIREYCSRHLIARTSWLFGRNGANFIRTILAAAKKGSPLRVVNDQRGSPTYSKDLAAQTRMMLEAGCRGIYHVTNSGACSWFDLASRVLEWAGISNISIVPVSTSEYPRPAQRPANSVLANSRLQRDGLPAMRSWQLAAREYVENQLREIL